MTVLFPNPDHRKAKIERNKKKERVKDASFREMQAILGDDADVAADPDLLAARATAEREIPRVRSQARRIQMMMNTPGNAEQKQIRIQKFLGEITSRGIVEVSGNEEKAMRYSRLVLGRLRNVINEERYAELETAFDNVPDDRMEGDRYDLMDSILHDGEVFEIPQDEDELIDHRYFYQSESEMGAIRVRTDLVQQDLEVFTPPPPLQSEAAVLFQQFLQELSEADMIEHYTSVTLPEFAKQHEPESLKDAKGALKALLLFGLLTLAAVSFFNERKNGFPLVAAGYLALAAAVYNPDVFSGSPIDQMRRTLSFTVPVEGQPDRWAELMEGRYSAEFTGDPGVALFETMLNANVQLAYSDYKDGLIAQGEFYQIVEDNQEEDTHTEFLRRLEQERPDLFGFILGNTALVVSPEDQIELKSLAQKGISAGEIAAMLADD